MPPRMPSPIRIDIPNVVYEETFRCQQSRFLLLPQEEFDDIVLGAIGRGLGDGEFRRGERDSCGTGLT